MARKLFWYDGFMGNDDALALELLTKCDDAELVGLSRCFSIEDRNVEITSEIERNTSLKIHCGSQRPIIAHASIARDYSFEERETEPDAGFAWNAIYDTAKKSKGISILCAGSLTNIALAMLRYEDFSKYIERILFIAGTVGIGDSTVVSERKAALDAYAVKTVLTSGVKLLYIGTEAWDAQKATPADLISCALRVEKLETKKATMDIETVVCNQFARTVLDTRVRNKAHKNVDFYFLTESEGNL